MTTNEQIIIDGVDVSGCKYLYDDDHLCELTKEMAYDDEEFVSFCKGSLNCHYKQLQRKTTKYNEIKESLGLMNGELVVKTAECGELQDLCRNQAKTINDLTGCVGLWEEFSEEESELAKNSSIADLVVLLREARSSLESKTTECEDLKERLAVANFEIESLQESQEPFKQHLDKLERKLQIATEALKFYATSHPDGSINTAQQALEQIESEK